MQRPVQKRACMVLAHRIFAVFSSCISKCTGRSFKLAVHCTHVPCPVNQAGPSNLVPSSLFTHRKRAQKVQGMQETDTEQKEKLRRQWKPTLIKDKEPLVPGTVKFLHHKEKGKEQWGSWGLEAWPETRSWWRLIIVLESVRLVWTGMAA